MLASSVAARSQTCGKPYTIKEGETLAQIAARTYGDPNQWTIIYYANQAKLGGDVSLLVPGAKIILPCVARIEREANSNTTKDRSGSDGGATSNKTAPSANRFLISSSVRRIEFLTAEGFAPYTGRQLEGGGMMTQIVSAAMNLVKKETKERFKFNISWVNDWSAHLNPLLSTQAFDVGFPWSKPNCANYSKIDPESRFRCKQFFFSQPIHEAITVLFVRADGSIKSLDENQIQGKSICVPAGLSANSLDEQGRNWVSGSKVILFRPSSVNECFRLLGRGQVDGVAVAELVGELSVQSQGLAAKVRKLETPLSLTSMHLLVAKSHPKARIILYYINTAFTKLRESGKYDEILKRQLSHYWRAQSNKPDPSLGNVPSRKQQQPARGGASKAASASGKRIKLPTPKGK